MCNLNHLLSSFAILFLVSNVYAQCMEAPSVVDLSATRIGVSWNEFPDTNVYLVQQSNSSHPTLFFTVYSAFTTSVRLSVVPATPAHFRIIASNLCTSETFDFPGTIPLPPTIAEISPFAGPTVVQVSSSKLSTSWPAFASIEYEYSLEIYTSGNWISIFSTHCYAGDNTLTALIAVTYADIIPGIPYFFRVSANNISTASTIFSMSSESSSGGYDPSFLIVNELVPLEATLTSVGEPNTGLATNTLLGGTKATEMLIRYEVPINFKECSFLHAKLQWQDPLITNFTLLNGNHLRAYAALESNWDAESVTGDTSPVLVDENYYLSDNQITKNNSIVDMALDHFISEELFISSYLQSWAAGEENRGFLLTLHPSTGKLVLPGLPSLIVVTAPPESIPSLVSTEIEFPNSSSTQGGTACSFCGPSLCNFDPQWNEEIPLVSTLVIPTGQTVFRVGIILNGNFQSDPNSPGRITISLHGTPIADAFLDENILTCGEDICEEQNFLSPVYPLLAGGWPGFDYETIENNRLSIIYTDDICIHSVEISLFFAAPDDPNCPSVSPTPSPTPFSSTPSPSISIVASESNSPSPTSSFTASISKTLSSSSSPSVSKTINFTESNSPSGTVSPSHSASTSHSLSTSLSSSQSPSLSATRSSSGSISHSRSIGSSVSPSTSLSCSPSTSLSASPSASLSMSSSFSVSSSPSRIGVSPSPLSSSTTSPSVLTSSHSQSSTPSPSSSQSLSQSRTSSESQSRTSSESQSALVSHSLSASASSSLLHTPSPSNQESTSPSAFTSKSSSKNPSKSTTNSKSRGISQIPIIGPSTTSSTPQASIIRSSVIPTHSIIISVVPSESRGLVVQEEIVPLAENTENTNILILDTTGFVIGSVLFLGETNNENLSISNPRISIPSNEEIASNIFDLSLLTADGLTQEVTEDVRICITTIGEKIKTEDFCLGFIDESKTPPRWVCQDFCLEKEKDELCGITDHFTSFALLLTGKGDDGCGNSGGGDFIFAKEWQDSLLIASVTLFIVSFLICIVVLLLWCPKGLNIVYGKEGARVKQLRGRHIAMVDMSNPNEDDFV